MKKNELKVKKNILGVNAMDLMPFKYFMTIYYIKKLFLIFLWYKVIRILYSCNYVPIIK